MFFFVCRFFHVLSFLPDLVDWEPRGLLLSNGGEKLQEVFFPTGPLNEKLIFVLRRNGAARSVLHQSATELETFWCSFSCSHN